MQHFFILYVNSQSKFHSGKGGKLTLGIYDCHISRVRTYRRHCRILYGKFIYCTLCFGRNASALYDPRYDLSSYYNRRSCRIFYGNNFTEDLGLTLLRHSGVSLVFTGIISSVLAASEPKLAVIVTGTIAAAAVINEIIAVITAKKGFELAGEIQNK